MDLQAKTAVITGGASGMGRATAERLHRHGVNVSLFDIGAEKGRSTADSLGSNAVFHSVDVTNEQQVRSALAKTQDVFGDIHICCNFAGIAVMNRVIGKKGVIPLEKFTTTLNVNLVGTFNVVRLCAEQMINNVPFNDLGGRGVVINTASIAAFQGPSGTVAYSASKAAIVGMTLPLARDLAPFGIRVNTIAPGLVFTPMTYGGDERNREAAMERAQQALGEVLYPKRFGTSDEVAHLAQSIIENDYINAECIRIDGGKHS